MPKLTASQRAKLPDSAFAYIDSAGHRRLPIHDEAHVRNALARFERVRFEDDASRERARRRLLNAAKRYRMVPVGFITAQFRTERNKAASPVDLPVGEVTFVFADIEGSTALLSRLGDQYAHLLDDVRGIARRAVRRAGGSEVDARADEYFAVFVEPASAIQATVSLQRALRDRRWPGEVECRVRVGIHTGEPRRTDSGYVGLPVHAAARICFAANGGQIVLSEQTRRAVGPSLPEGVTLRGLGRHRLAGLPGTHLLYQVEAEDLSTEEFPPLRRAAPSRRRELRSAPSTAPGDADRAFRGIVARLSTEPGVSEGTGFGAGGGLRVDGRIFLIFSSDCLVVKLPRARVDGLVQGGIATRFDPRRDGRAMREWATVGVAHRRRWPKLAYEALEFVRAGRR